ncbi:hypothetical protein ADUPG1_004375, partial [Aduncisulcus paluster]
VVPLVIVLIIVLAKRGLLNKIVIVISKNPCVYFSVEHIHIEVNINTVRKTRVFPYALQSGHQLFSVFFQVAWRRLSLLQVDFHCDFVD